MLASQGDLSRGRQPQYWTLDCSFLYCLFLGQHLRHSRMGGKLARGAGVEVVAFPGAKEEDRALPS